MLIFICFLG